MEYTQAFGRKCAIICKNGKLSFAERACEQQSQMNLRHELTVQGFATAAGPLPVCGLTVPNSTGSIKQTRPCGAFHTTASFHLPRRNSITLVIAISISAITMAMNIPSTPQRV